MWEEGCLWRGKLALGQKQTRPGTHALHILHFPFFKETRPPPQPRKKRAHPNLTRKTHIHTPMVPGSVSRKKSENTAQGLWLRWGNTQPPRLPPKI